MRRDRRWPRMRFDQLAVLLLIFGSSTGNSAAPHRVAPAVRTQGKTPPDEPPAGKRAITLPTGTKVAVALTGPLWSKTAHAGDGVYAVSVFPVAVAQHMAIPPGTYIEGRIDLIKRPTWIVPRAEFRMHFTKLIFANGYTVDLPAPQRPAHLMAANAPAPNQAA